MIVTLLDILIRQEETKQKNEVFVTYDMTKENIGEFFANPNEMAYQTTKIYRRFTIKIGGSLKELYVNEDSFHLIEALLHSDELFHELERLRLVNAHMEERIIIMVKVHNKELNQRDEHIKKLAARLFKNRIKNILTKFKGVFND